MTNKETKERKPQAFFMSENHGMFTRYCQTKDKATALFNALWDEDKIAYEDCYGKLDLTEIKEERMYFCKRCDMYTCGGRNCIECDRRLPRRSIKTFTINF